MNRKLGKCESSENGFDIKGKQAKPNDLFLRPDNKKTIL